MLIVRSVVYNVLFYLNTLVYLLAALPTFWMPYRCIVEMAKAWGRTNNWLLRVVCGTRVEIRGIEKIPHGPLLIAAKHQSTWETFTLIGLFADPTFIIKRELLWLPLFGWYVRKGRMIPVNRGGRAQALAGIAKQALIELAGGRQLVIFPEGTRRPAGAEPSYRYGIVHLYAETGAACLPIALNSGLYWPRRSMLRYPGTIRVEILDPIPSGMDKKAFAARLRDDIEAASARLVEEGRRELSALGFDLTPLRRDLRRPSAAPPEDEARSPDSRAPRAP